MQGIQFADFIYGAKINDTVCDNLIKFFEGSEKKQVGKLGHNRYEPEKKDSTDLCIDAREQNPVIQNYLSELEKVCNLYVNFYEYSSKGQAKWQLNEPCNIQRYLPGQGFKSWHTERTAPFNLNPLRHLVFMTYLNDVPDGGTEWYYQDLKLPAEKGLTILWPADWTHTHRGIISMSTTKYIITGWYSYNLEKYNYKTIEGNLNDSK